MNPPRGSKRRGAIAKTTNLSESVLPETPDRVKGVSFSSSQKRDLKNQTDQEKLTDEQIQKYRSMLPHRYGYPWYPWAREFFESTNRQNFLCAANQISKSSTQIRKAIEWAVNPELWPKLWPETHRLGKQPRSFWYLYPSRTLTDTEVLDKWVPEFLPRDEMKEHPKYGWKFIKVGANIGGIAFNTGVNLYFKTYMQNAKVLQAGTVHAIFCDEELPIELYDELLMRLNATDGYFHMVFTATLNQIYWKQVIEGVGSDELLPEAFKQQVTMYDCTHYEDGSRGAYTEEKIELIKSRCQSETEVARRVYGKFVTEEGRKYAAFESSRHMVEPREFPVPPYWPVYSAVDVGSGGSKKNIGGTKKKAHPAAIVFVAVKPDYTKGVVFVGWRGDDQQTTSGDILNKWVELSAQVKPREIRQKFYDWQAKDFKIISDRLGVPFEAADKSHERGEDILNTLFRNDMLVIWKDEELQKLGTELQTLMKSTSKSNAIDDFCDALRYCVTKIPWNWEGIQTSKEEKPEKKLVNRELTSEELEIKERRRIVLGDERQEDGHEANWSDVEDEIEEWNELYSP